jgi:hypothetical protein
VVIILDMKYKKALTALLTSWNVPTAKECPHFHGVLIFIAVLRRDHYSSEPVESNPYPHNPFLLLSFV